MGVATAMATTAARHRPRLPSGSSRTSHNASGSDMARTMPNSIGWPAVPDTRRNEPGKKPGRTLFTFRPGRCRNFVGSKAVLNCTIPIPEMMAARTTSRRTNVCNRSSDGMPSAATIATPVRPANPRTARLAPRTSAPNAGRTAAAA